jgi:hypothetical protein
MPGGPSQDGEEKREGKGGAEGAAGGRVLCWAGYGLWLAAKPEETMAMMMGARGVVAALAGVAGDPIRPGASCRGARAKGWLAQRSLPHNTWVGSDRALRRLLLAWLAASSGSVRAAGATRDNAGSRASRSRVSRWC